MLLQYKPILSAQLFASACTTRLITGATCTQGRKLEGFSCKRALTLKNLPFHEPELNLAAAADGDNEPFNPTELDLCRYRLAYIFD
jgi:hypothetical protein